MQGSGRPPEMSCVRYAVYAVEKSDGRSENKWLFSMSEVIATSRQLLQRSSNADLMRCSAVPARSCSPSGNVLSRSPLAMRCLRSV